MDRQTAAQKKAKSPGASAVPPFVERAAVRQVPTPTVARPQTAGDAMRAERDRFVALAFAAGDVLIELDAEQRILFAGGATAAHVGASPGQLVGTPFLDIVAATDRPMMREALAHAVKGRRLRNILVRLHGANEDVSASAPLALVGYRLPEMDGRFYLSLRAGGPEPRLSDDDSVPLVTGGDSGLPNPRSFAALVGERLAASRASATDELGRTHDLTLLRMFGLNELRRRLGREARGQLAAAIGGGLRALAVNGDLAGQFDGEAFGLVHAKDVDVDAFVKSVVDLARALDNKAASTTKAKPSSEVLRVGTVKIDLDVHNMGQPELVKAMVYAVNRFADGRIEDFKIVSLSAALGAMIGETVHKLGEFRTVVATADFAMAFQPVVQLETRDIQHFEVLARFPSFGDRLTPYEAITFAEQTGLICDFDLAMCAKALAWLESGQQTDKSYRLAVNLSGSSIGTPTFVKALHKLLKRHEGVRRQVLFEITESARIVDLRGVNAVLRGLRAEGHKVCLDDFGAGASAFHYLRALDVDFVKIDGAYVRDAFKTSKGAAFLKAMATLSSDLGIATVAEMVEDESNVAFLKQCGISYGQGWLFGKPSLDIADFTGAVREPTLARRATGRSA